MAFLDDIIFPTELAYGSSGGPAFGNVIQRTPAGRVSVLMRTTDPPSKWSVRWSRSAESSAAILSFARVTHGAANGFRFLDFNDFSTTPDHVSQWSASTSSHRHEIGVGDGSTTRFPLSKTYAVGSNTKTRRIRKPLRLSEAQASANQPFLSGLVTESQMHAVWVAGVQKTLSTHFSIDYETGEVVFVSAPSGSAVIEWAGFFAVPARFGPNADEQLTMIHANYAEREFDQIDVEEIIEATVQVVPERWGGGSSYHIEEASAAQRLVSFADGELVRIDADATSPSPFPLKLPTIATWMEGGPAFRIVNIGGSKNVQVQTSTGTAVVTLSAGDTAELWVGINSAGTSPEWQVL